MLQSIGIRRGQRFSPDAQRVAQLESAVDEAHAFLRHVYENEPAFTEGQHWFFPAECDFIEGQGDNFANGEVYPYTDRGVIYHMAFIGLKRLGIGQSYLVAVHDHDGNPLRSDATYRMRVPPLSRSRSTGRSPCTTETSTPSSVATRSTRCPRRHLVSRSTTTDRSTCTSAPTLILASRPSGISRMSSSSTRRTGRPNRARTRAQCGRDARRSEVARAEDGVPVALHAHDDPALGLRVFEGVLGAGCVGELAVGVVVQDEQAQRRAVRRPREVHHR